MLSYLKKFNNLSAELRERVSNPAAMMAIEKLESKFKLPLAAFIMKVMVKEIVLADLAQSLLKENLTEAAAGQLAEELKEKIFFSLENYLSPPASPNLAPLPQKIQPSEFKPLAMAIEPSVKPLVKGASFFFSPDDEREIRELARKIDLAERVELPAEKIGEKLEAIINRAQINFGSADLAGRFRQILTTYLRGIRNKLETKLTLSKPFANGGLSFDEDSAQKVMDMADKILSSKLNLSAGQAGGPIKPPEKIKISEVEKVMASQPAIERDAPYDFLKLAKEKKNVKATTVRLEDVSHELAPLTPARLAQAPAKPAVAAVKPQPATLPPVKKPLPARVGNKAFVLSGEPGLPTRQAVNTGQMPLIRRRFEAENLNRSQKVKVEDVKYVPRVMSPLDELKYLDLLNFRRLDKDPLRAIEKIKSRISLLEEEGYGKKLEGIRLWRFSPVNRLYLEIGHLSISENKPVDVIIEERKMKGEGYLAAAEFKAIMDLNKSLRF